MPPARRPLALLSALVLLIAAARPAAAQPSPPVSAWPIRIDTTAGQLSMYQPQPDTFEGDQLSARSAVSLLPPGATEPQFGAAWFAARVFTDRDARTVTIQDLDVRQVKLPEAQAGQEAGFAAVLKQQLPQMNVTFSLDQLEASLGVVTKARAESQQLENAPPQIVYRPVPTTLVVLDGDPKLQPAEGVAGVLRVVNTPFILLLDGGTRQFYLKAGERWMTAPAVTGPWQPAGAVPGGVAAEGANLSVQNQPDPTAAPAAAAAPAEAVATQIMVATVPTELISSDGPAVYTPLPGNDLLYMANTAGDEFLEVSTQRHFVLLSGRWYVSPSLENGPWQYVPSDRLPPAFAQIPPDSPKADVLVSVAGTQRAADARMDAYVPQTTSIRRDSGTSLSVTYDGDPQFVPVQGTPLTYAANCPDPVVYVDRSYYCCHQAVWYQSPAAVGPWAVCVAVPGVIYTIPPSCPIYPCRYVYVYDSTPDLVYCGYLPGYTGCYVYGPTVVYGTGYAYPYWYHSQFIPRPYTFGFAPRYAYATGAWGFGAGRYYGPSWFAAGPAVGPARRDWFGPQGYVDYRDVHQNRTTIINNYGGGGGGGGRQPAVVNRNVTINRINIYNRQENVTRNVFVNRNTTTVNYGRNTNVRETNVRTDVHAAPPARGGTADDVYAGRDGQVYRRTDQGWQQRSGRTWVDAKTNNPGGNARPAVNAPDHQQAPQQDRDPQQRQRQEAARTEAARTEAARTEAARTEAARTEAARNQAAEQQRQQDAARQDAGRQDAARQDAARQGHQQQQQEQQHQQAQQQEQQRQQAESQRQQAESQRQQQESQRQQEQRRGNDDSGLEAEHQARQRGSNQHADDSGGGGRGQKQEQSQNQNRGK